MRERREQEPLRARIGRDRCDGAGGRCRVQEDEIVALAGVCQRDFEDARAINEFREQRIQLG